MQPLAPDRQGMQAAKDAHDTQLVLGRLRRDIARLEGRLADEARLELAATVKGAGRPAGVGACAAESATEESATEPATETAIETVCDQVQPLGAPRLDAMLGGGLRLAELHEVRAAETRDGASAAGFVIAVLARLEAAADRRRAGHWPAGRALPIVWISEADRRREAGELYPPGLAALGIDPGRIIRIAAARTADALWAFEAALACRGVAFAVCEVRRPASVLDLTGTRRCALRAQGSGATGFLLRLAETPQPTAALTRFLVAPAPSAAAGHAAGLGRPAWRVELEKARTGRTGVIDLEWNADDRSFAEPGAVQRSAHPVTVAAAACDRPSGAGRQSAA